MVSVDAAYRENITLVDSQNSCGVERHRGGVHSVLRLIEARKKSAPPALREEESEAALTAAERRHKELPAAPKIF